ncbi:CinA family protein [Nocardia sp. NPDC004415]
MRFSDLAAALSAAPDSAQWFRGGVVAYSALVKQQVLGEPVGSVWCAVVTRAESWAVHRDFDGDPEAVLSQSVDCALALLHEGQARLVSGR